MIKKTIIWVSNTVIISLFVLNTGIANEKPKQNLANNHPSYSTQDDLIYLYSSIDEGLMDSREIYELDRIIYDIVSNPKKLNHSEFDAIDFELYTKGQE